MNIKKIRPMPGCSVAYPTAPYADIPEDGCLVEWPGPGSYWTRRLRDGSIEVVVIETTPEPTTAQRAKVQRAPKED
jgi:hypothetical protein